MIFSATQVADAQGPDTPGCDCPGCTLLRRLKTIICEQIEAIDTEILAQRDGSQDHAHAPWLGVLMLAAARASAQGFSTHTIGAVAAHGVEQSQMLNPMLHYTANAEDKPL